MNRREFDRFPIELTIRVVATDGDGEAYDEKTGLIQISGGGARFVTCMAEKYFIGQILGITIDMPGTAEVKATLRGTATVLRIEPSSPSGDGEEERPEMCIAIKFNNRLHFARD